LQARSLIAELGWLHVPAGTVARGTPSDEIDSVVARHADVGIPRLYVAKEAPRATVHVPSFLVLRTPITVEAWNTFARDTGRDLVGAHARHPIDNRSFAEAEAFCAWYSEAAGEGARLPSEIEWERAARGHEEREYPWGERFDPACGNLAEAGVGTTTPVGSYPSGASPFGLLDMAGNTDEWTSTLYAPYPGAPPDVPALEAWALDPHVVRGGSWRHFRDLARCARRHGLYPNTNGETGVGFRLVRL
jgi:formylglycine-generating enzyme required for sulfatase activity